MHSADGELDELVYPKTSLLERMKHNRNEHRSVFEEAIEGWHKAVVAALEQSLRDAVAGKRYDIAIHLPRPEDHTRDYDRVIAMLEMTHKNEIVLSEAEFAKYVLDDWGWRQQFLAVASGYSARAMAKLRPSNSPENEYRAMVAAQDAAL